MTENPPEKKNLDEECEKPSSEKKKAAETGAWEEDRKKHGYYYDDAHGYEIYEADEDEEDNIIEQ